ncbi:MAG: nuclear transport factor 2 family protein [Roseivirga sp.]|nr:nuclear transport factor 2 family protein [Roseivirga sp.]
MKRTLILTALLLLIATAPLSSNNLNPTPDNQQTDKRIPELDQYWTKLSKTVREGDFEGYSSLYHKDAVIIFTTGSNKVSVAVAEALAGWKQGFAKTKAGEQKDNVEFRFSQRIGNANTAHETGIFHFTSVDNSGKTLTDILVHFEMLFVKKDGVWLSTMEYQKSTATQAEWEALN